MTRPLVLLDTARVPGEAGELRLLQDGEHYTIKIAGSGDLMSTRMHGSEEALADIGCATIATRERARVLVGGLGFGFTLAAALARLRDDARIVVAELVPAVVTWNRERVGAHAGHPLRDPRVDVHDGDVAEAMRTEPAGWDAILLDVDNGPEGLTRAGNDRLYSRAGLASAHASLRPGGVLAIWSAHRDAAFSVRLRECGFEVEEVAVRAHANRGARHLVWRATRKPPPAGASLRGGACRALPR
jgi:spermidine synthase